MMPTDKLNIKLRIAGLVVQLSIDRSEEELLREVSSEVNRVFETYRNRFTHSSDMEILAKVTLLFAKGYISQAAAAKELDAKLGKFEDELDKLLDET